MQKGSDRLQKQVMKIIKGVKNLSCEERLNALVPEEEKAQLGARAHHSVPVLKEWLQYKSNGGSLFTWSHMESTKDNGCKLHWERFHHDLRKNSSDSKSKHFPE